jgi:hypothetical protein
MVAGDEQLDQLLVGAVGESWCSLCPARFVLERHRRHLKIGNSNSDLSGTRGLQERGSKIDTHHPSVPRSLPDRPH